jgi:peptidoglycan hydrolase-like protein with peptidoglycan-binding domain
LTEAVIAFQTELGVEPTGTVDAATVSALKEAIADLQQPESAPTPTPTPTEEP